MMNKLLKMSLATALTLASFSSYASTDEAKKVHVQISNQTPYNCQLTKTDVRHGKLLTPAPLSLPKGDAGGFLGQQGSLRGSTVVLSYSCGPNDITFKTHQHLVKITGSTPVVNVLKSNNIDLHFEALASSVLHNKTGILNITLK